MNTFEKLLLLKECRDESQREELLELFSILDSFNLEYRILSIPILNLKVEDFIPADRLTEFVEITKHLDLEQKTINFHIFVPELNWIFDIRSYPTLERKNHLESYIRLKSSNWVASLFKDDDCSTAHTLEFQIQAVTGTVFSQILEKALERKFREMNIETPNTRNSFDVKSSDEFSGMTFGKYNFDRLKRFLEGRKK